VRKAWIENTAGTNFFLSEAARSKAERVKFVKSFLFLFVTTKRKIRNISAKKNKTNVRIPYISVKKINYMYLNYNILIIIQQTLIILTEDKILLSLVRVWHFRDLVASMSQIITSH